MVDIKPAWNIKKITTIDAEAIKIMNEILRQNKMILELLCNPTIEASSSSVPVGATQRS